jgi:hypothetical protein
MQFPSNDDFRADFDAAQARAKSLFDLVACKHDWKAPINGVLEDPALLGPVSEAVIHFTATVPTITPVMIKGRKTLLYKVKAAGYRAGPAGP